MGFGWGLTGAIPALLVMWYFDRLDAKRPEPRSTLRKISVAGAFSIVPAILLGLLLSPLGPGDDAPFEQAAYHGFVIAAAVEEASKIFVVYWLVWRRPEFDERMDGIVYAARAGLGFALVENVFYLAGTATVEEFVIVFVARALLAVPGHAIWTGLMGYFAARQRFDKAGPGLIGGYLIAVALHGVYDVAIFWHPLFVFEGQKTLAFALLAIPLAVIIGGAIAIRRLARRAVALDDLAEHHAHRAALAAQAAEVVPVPVPVDEPRGPLPPQGPY